MKEKGWIGKDIHKSARPEVAESGGISVLIGIISGLIILMIFIPAISLECVAVIISVISAALIGLIDDKLRLSAFKKIISVIFAAIPITTLYLLTNIIPGEPVVPFLGELRVTILYIPFIPAFLAVLMNAVNMLEGYNGEGSGTSIIVVIALLVGSVIMSPSSNNSTTAFFMSCILLSALIAFFIFNKFPARVFPGDIGTLQVGMMLGCIAILGNLEFVLIIAIMPHIFNAFHVIRSVRGFKESKTIEVKDIKLIKDDLIKASVEKEAPMTIPRIIAAYKPISEPKLVFNIIMLNVVSTLLSIFSSVLVQATLDNHLFIIETWIWALLILAVSIIIAFIIPTIRGLVVAFLLVFFGVLGLLLFIDMYVIGLELINWLVAGALAFGGLLAWYMLSMRYFNHVILRSSKTS